MNPNPLQIAYVSTFPPKKCGLATYTHHLRDAVQQAKGGSAPDPVIALCQPEETELYGDSWITPLPMQERALYRQAADRLNDSPVDVVSLQHEFGIFGGEAGRYVLDFLERLRKPVVTTFHTVFEQPPALYKPVQAEIAKRSRQLHVMNRKAVGSLTSQFDVPAEKITFIPHGAPVPPRKEDRATVRRLQNWHQRKVVFQFGLLSRSKGVEFVLRAMAEAVQAVPELLYVIAGQTHPEVRRYEGEAYREQLTRLIAELGLEHHVRMIDRYVPEEELVSLLSAADLYVTPYPGLQQVTSGTLAYAAGLGKPTLSTPYSYAKDLLQGIDGLLLPSGDVKAWSERLIDLFTYPEALRQCERRMAEIGRNLHWPLVGEQHLRLFEQAAGRRRLSVADVG